MKKFNLQRSAQLESALKNNLRRDDNQKNRTDQRVEAEEREVDPVQAAAARNPMFQHKAADNDQPANNICEAKMAEQSEREQQSAHDHVREKRGGQRVFRSPRDDKRTQPMRLVELVILQRVDDVEA